MDKTYFEKAISFEGRGNGTAEKAGLAGCFRVDPKRRR